MKNSSHPPIFRTDELLEAFKYGRVMAEQWTVFMRNSSNAESKKWVGTYLKTLFEGVPDILTNKEYELSF